MLPGLTRQEFKSLLLSVGKATRARRPLAPIEVGELCAKSISKGAKPKEITKSLQMSDVSMISKFLRLKKLSPEIRHLIDWGFSGEGAIGFSVAAQLARMPVDKQSAASEAILKYQLTRNEMISVFQLLERTKDSLGACVERVVHRRPVIRIRQIVLGSVTSVNAKTKLSSLSQVMRDKLLGQIISRLFPAAKDIVAKLGTERFAIIGGMGIAKRIAMDSRVEKSINECLEKQLA